MSARTFARTNGGQNRRTIKMHGDPATSDIHSTTPDTSARTIAQMCADNGTAVETVRQAWNRARSSGIVVRPYTQENVPTVEEIQAVAPLRKIMGQAKNKHTAAPKKAALPIERVKAVHGESGVRRNEDEGAHPAPPAVVVAPVVGVESHWKRPLLYLAVGVIGLISWQNIAAVTGHLFESWFNSQLITAVFTFAAPFLAWAGMMRGWGSALVILMVLFEGLCNVTRIYGGLTNFDTPGRMGYPTRFLGLVTDICDSGTLMTAKIIAVVMSALLCGLFFIFIFELKKEEK